MMKFDKNFILMSAKRALLTYVKPHLRAVCVDIADQVVEAHFYFHGSVSEVDQEDMECVMTEIMSDFPIYDDAGKEFTYKYMAHQVDAPQPLNCVGYWAYYRYE